MHFIEVLNGSLITEYYSIRLFQPLLKERICILPPLFSSEEQMNSNKRGLDHCRGIISLPVVLTIELRTNQSERRY